MQVQQQQQQKQQHAATIYSAKTKQNSYKTNFLSQGMLLLPASAPGGGGGGWRQGNPLAPERTRLHHLGGRHGGVAGGGEGRPGDVPSKTCISQKNNKLKINISKGHPPLPPRRGVHPFEWDTLVRDPQREEGRGSSETGEVHPQDGEVGRRRRRTVGLVSISCTFNALLDIFNIAAVGTDRRKGTRTRTALTRRRRTRRTLDSK